MHRTTYTVVVLSEDPIPAQADLVHVLREADTGDYVAVENVTSVEQLDGPQMAQARIAAGSDPGFFRLDDDGNRVDDF